jgi:hypothetical protein
MFLVLETIFLFEMLNNNVWEHPHTNSLFADQQATHTPQVNSTWLHINGSSYIYSALPYSSLANHFLLLISTALVFIQRSTSNQISAPYSLTNQRSQQPLQVQALRHLDLYKRRSSQPAIISGLHPEHRDRPSDSAVTSTQ